MAAGLEPATGIRTWLHHLAYATPRRVVEWKKVVHGITSI